MTKRRRMAREVKERAETETKKQPEYHGDDRMIVSTGSTLLDLAIMGTRVRGGGLPAGIMVEVFGPEGAGKTVMLSEIAGSIQRKGGQVKYNDTEGRLDLAFCSLFGANIKQEDLFINSTIEGTFKDILKWEVEDTENVSGYFIDSLANLNTEDELDPDKSAGYGGARRAAVFTENLRRVSDKIKNDNLLVVCSNQIRDKLNAMPFGKQTKAAGASRATLHATSLRLELTKVKQLSEKIKVRTGGKEIKNIFGVETRIFVEKSSVDIPYRSAPMIIIFDYGVDDIRANLQWYKEMTGDKVFWGGNNALAKSIELVEEEGKEDELREAVICLWEEMQEKIRTTRKKKQRWDE